MAERNLRVILERAIANLFEHQPNILEMTVETGQTEWNLAHHLAEEIHRFLPDLDLDLDVLKRSYENRRPDMVFHRRGTHENNYLVIELKVNGSPKDVAADAEKITSLWFKEPLQYAFGATINLRLDGKHAIQVFENAAKAVNR